uniref:Uncharacterized protein n=1 Tax=Papilio polytes TaxID=76194 RepID=I4DSC7_PAPPL|nr:unknown unsecreted protein [Papilio polytes]
MRVHTGTLANFSTDTMVEPALISSHESVGSPPARPRPRRRQASSGSKSAFRQINLVLCPFPFHPFLKRKGWEGKVDLTVEETHRQWKYPLYVRLLLRQSSLDNASAIADVYGQRSLSI